VLEGWGGERGKLGKGGGGDRYRNPKRPYIRRSTPAQIEHALWAPKDRGADEMAFLDCVDVHAITEIGKFDVTEAVGAIVQIHEDVVECYIQPFKQI